MTQRDTKCQALRNASSRPKPAPGLTRGAGIFLFTVTLECLWHDRVHWFSRAPLKIIKMNF